MATKTKKKDSIGDQIKEILRRNQRWLAREIRMSEPELSNKLNGLVPFTSEEIEDINSILGTNFQL